MVTARFVYLDGRREELQVEAFDLPPRTLYITRGRILGMPVTALDFEPIPRVDVHVFDLKVSGQCSFCYVERGEETDEQLRARLTT